MFHMQSGEVKIAEHTKIEISINKHGKSSKESETLFWNVALKVSTINWKLTCKTIHSDTQVIQTVPIGKYTFKHKTVKYRRSSMVLKAIRQKVYQEKRKIRHFLPLKRKREEVVLRLMLVQDTNSLWAYTSILNTSPPLACCYKRSICGKNQSQN